MPSDTTLRRRARKRAIVEALGGCCDVCGEDRLPVLTLHHRYPAARSTPNAHGPSVRVLWDRALTPAVWAEVWLCRLLCANCHMMEEYGG